MLRTACMRRAALGLRPRRRLPHRALSSIRTATRASHVSSAALAAAAPLTLAFAATTYARAEASHDAAIEAARIRAQRLADAAEKAAQLRRTPSRWRLLRRAMNLSLRATPLIVGRLTADVSRMLGIRAVDDLWWSWCLREVERAGPTFIKLCQWAASRDDLFPVQATRRFARLHDRVEPHSYEQTQLSVSKAFGDQDLTIGPILGSGCVAQVHRGTLHGRDVAVKVVHPGVRELVDCDMCLLRGIGSIIEYWAPSLKYLAVRGTLQRFEKVMRAQLDLRTEAANLEKLHLLFCEDENVVIPRPVLDVNGIDGAQRDVLVEDFVEGSRRRPYTMRRRRGGARRRAHQS
jgi:predicted unusual protein kinase regulating ubiquinone biosynthesis (AarF/ABC1/UbiB family)